MKKRLSLIASVLAVAAVPAMAGTFDGLQGSVGIHHSQTRLQGSEAFDNTGADLGFARGDATHNRTGLKLGIGYGISTGPWQTTFGVDYLDGRQELRADDGAGNAYGLDVTRRIDAYVAPGYALDRDSVVYAKLGYSHLTLDNAFNASTGGLAGGPGHHAVIYGVGFKQKIGDTASPLFYTVEYTTGSTTSGALTETNGNTSDSKLKLSTVGLSLGYLFN